MKNKRKEKKKKEKKKEKEKEKTLAREGWGREDREWKDEEDNTELKILSFRQTCPLKPQFKATKSQLEKLFRKIKIREN